MENNTTKSSSISEIKDKYIGIAGTVSRDKYESKLKIDVLKRMRKTTKTKTEILDVDFIGEQTPLTSEEEKAISDFFRLKKDKNRKQKTSIYKSTNENKISI